MTSEYVICLSSALILLSTTFCIQNCSKGFFAISAKKKNETILLIVFLFILITIMGGSNQNPDSAEYQRIFDMPFYAKDYGFGIIILFCKYLGLEFDSLRLIIATVGILLINSVVRKYLGTTEQSLLYIIYFIFPFFMDVTQVRNFLSMSILIYAIDVIATGRKKHQNMAKAAMLIIIAASIQKLFIIYLPLVLLDRKKGGYGYKKIILMIAIGSLSVLWCKPFMTMIADMLQHAPIARLAALSHYLSKTTRLGGYTIWFLVLICAVFMYYCLQIQESCNNLTDDPKREFSNLVCWANLYAAIFLPLALITLDFFRIQRNLFILDYIVVFITESMMVKADYKGLARTVVPLCGLGIIAYSFFWTYIYDGSIYTVIQPIMTNNWIIEKIVGN